MRPESFVDNAEIYVKAGNGGKGCRSFYRDKYKRFGVPDGGDGGKGADIIIRADRNLHTLLDFKYNKHFYARSGGNASSKNQKGKDMPALTVRVPCGTIIRDTALNCLLGSLDHDAEQLTVARGGKGGLGNRRGREVTEPQAGEERDLLLDLKLIADAGIVGFPNAGKSTLITAVTKARPEIAAYPFTTKFPVLGVVHFEDDSFVIADIPGLIEGSSSGRGLGDRFLRHVERTRLLVHVIDMAGSEGRDPVHDYISINKELKGYAKDLSAKPQIIVANKMDLEGAQDNLKKFRGSVKKKVYPVSALEREGLEELIGAIGKKLQKSSS